MTCRQFKVSGRVQGVFFRVSTRDVAVPLNITGHAINLPDGSVEVLACGDAAALGYWRYRKGSRVCGAGRI
jgi:acylphosphatase